MEARSDLATALERTSSIRTRRPTIYNEMLLAARPINSGASPTVIYVHGFGDFDTHLDQEVRHTDLMSQFDEALAAFWSEVGENSNKVAVLTASEFGRRPKENGTGTDHGPAAAHVLIGPEVMGGRFGEAPSLRSLDRNGNLIHTVDYRSVYATVLDEWLTADADNILGGAYERLGVFA